MKDIDKDEAEEYVDTLLNKDDAELDEFLDEYLGDLKLNKKQAGAILGIIKGVGICSYLAGLKAGKDTNVSTKWHKVADGDLPKAYQKCYFIYSNFYKDNGKVDFSESSVEVRTGIYAFYLDEDTGEETADPCFYDDINDEEIILSEVYAWKEIILPELKESE